MKFFIAILCQFFFYTLLCSQIEGFQIRLNNMHFSGAIEEAFFEDEDLLVTPTENAKVSSYDVDFSIHYRIKGLRFVTRYGLNSYSSNSKIRTSSLESYRNYNRVSFNKKKTFMIGVSQQLRKTKNTYSRVMVESLLSHRKFLNSSITNDFYDSNDQLIATSKLDYKRPDIWSFGLDFGYNFNFIFIKRFGLSGDFSIPIYLTRLSGITERRISSTDVNNNIQQEISYHDEKDWIFSKGIRFSLGIVYSL